MIISALASASGPDLRVDDVFVTAAVLTVLTQKV